MVAKRLTTFVLLWGVVLLILPVLSAMQLAAAQSRLIASPAPVLPRVEGLDASEPIVPVWVSYAGRLPTAVTNSVKAAAPAMSTASALFGTASIITDETDGAVSVYAADVDGDGDLDVLSASRDDDKIAWYENGGGSSPNFTEHVITIGADGATSVYAADVDGDGDLDVLSGSSYDNKIAWYENDGSAPPAFTEHVITTAAGSVHSVYAVDVEGDGDLDVLYASWGDNEIAWYENQGGTPLVFTRHVVAADVIRATSVYAADVDRDGDVDVLSASRNDNEIAWYENDGGSPPAFVGHVITTFADGARSVYAADVDGDGDVDVLSASEDDDKLAWYENGGGSLPAFTEHVITTDADGAWSVYAADVDGDGDVDVLSASRDDDKIAWYENEGGLSPTFTEYVITTDARGACSVYATDVDGDGDVDVLSASRNDDKIAWYPDETIHRSVLFPAQAHTIITDEAEGAVIGVRGRRGRGRRRGCALGLAG